MGDTVRKGVFDGFVITLPADSSFKGIIVTGTLFSSRLVAFNDNNYNNGTRIDISGNNGVADIKIIDLSGNKGAGDAIILSQDYFYTQYTSAVNETISSNFDVSIDPKSKTEIESILRSIVSNNANYHIFFDSMFYYLKRDDASNSIQIDNQSVTADYDLGSANPKIYYYKSGLTYTQFKAEIAANEAATETSRRAYHALPARRRNSDTNSGPDLFSIIKKDSSTYDISNNNLADIISVTESGGAETTYNVGNKVHFPDFFLSLFKAPSAKLGFPLFEYGESLATNPTDQVTIPCLLKGTRVLTPSGYKNIESLAVNDIISNHYNEPMKVRKISKTVVKWSENPTLDKKVFKTPGYHPTYLTGWHRIRRQDGSFLQAYDCGFPVAKKEEICEHGDTFTIYHLNVDDWQNNHLVVNGGTVVESWSGISQ